MKEEKERKAAGQNEKMKEGQQQSETKSLETAV